MGGSLKHGWHILQVRLPCRVFYDPLVGMRNLLLFFLQHLKVLLLLDVQLHPSPPLRTVEVDFFDFLPLIGLFFHL